MFKCVFITAEMYSVLITCGMQKQKRDTKRIQVKTKYDNTTSPIIQHNTTGFDTQTYLIHHSHKYFNVKPDTLLLLKSLGSIRN